MGEDEIGTPGLGIMAHGVDQMLADKRSATSYQREKSLMNKQNMMNLSNAMTLPSIQAHGLRMAGFNPAMVNGAGTAAAPTVSKGSADMAQTNPLDIAGLAQLALLGAQADKLEADTDLVKAQTKTEEQKPEQVRQSTEYTIAQRLNTNADTTKKEEEARQIKNINDAYDTENDALGSMGVAMAEKWQKSDWYKKLGPDTKATIDAIASGEIPLSVGAISALEKVIGAQKDLSEADAAQVKNAFSNAVLESQFNDKAVFDAIVKDPEVKQNLTKKQTDKISAEIEKLRYKMKELIDLDLQGKSYSNQFTKIQAQFEQLKKKSFHEGDMDLSREEGRYANYAWLAFEKFASKAMDLIAMILAGKVAGKTIGKGIAEEIKPSTIVKPGDKGYTETIRSINRSPLPRSDGNGTMYFDFGAGR